MVWKVINISNPGTSSQYGADDTDKINKLLRGDTDVDTVNIDSPFQIEDDKFKLWNPANTFLYTFSTSAIIANRTITVPLLSSGDTLAFNKFVATFENKTLDSSCIISSAGSLPSVVAREDASNSYDDFDQIFKDNRILIWNPADTFKYTLVASAIGANRNLIIPLITADDTLSTLGLAQTFTAAKTFNTSTLKLRNPADTFSYTIVPAAITANRDLNIPLLVGTDTMGTQNNGLSNPYADSPSGASVRRNGVWWGVADTNADGLLSTGTTAIGATTNNVQDTTEGQGRLMTTGAVANANAGLRWTSTRFRREWGNYMIVRLSVSSTSDVRCFVGWSSDTAEIAGETTLNNFSGAGVGKRTGDTNWFTMVNDGDATEDRVDTTIAFGTSYVTIELMLDGTSFRSRIGTTTNTAVTSELPASSTMLAPHIEIETGSGAADKTINILPVFARTGAV